MDETNRPFLTKGNAKLLSSDTPAPRSPKISETPQCSHFCSVLYKIASSDFRTDGLPSLSYFLHFWKEGERHKRSMIWHWQITPNESCESPQVEHTCEKRGGNLSSANRHDVKTDLADRLTESWFWWTLFKHLDIQPVNQHKSVG